ncbi:hypothetical protein [Halorubellus litoreus]|uniref:Uncharacterized protein n=1 Tax=Halorubellus litoreus TaxID=755308 RepID=A0ABD5VCK0_9EURY
MSVPFPETADVAAGFGADQVTIAPDGTAYVVPSGMHERLRRAVVADHEADDRVEHADHEAVDRAEHADRDPKVALVLAGWVCLQADGMTDRVNVDAPDAFVDGAPIRRFARAHDAGSVAVARHPSGDVVTSSAPSTFAFDGRVE